MSVETGSERVTPVWETRMRDAAQHVEQDVRKVIMYINDEVVPDVRRHGSVALRSAAAELAKLAERMDHSRTSGSPTPPPRT